MSYNKILDNDIKTIKKDILKIVELTKMQYTRTFEAINSSNEELFQTVIDEDIKINDGQNSFTSMALWKIAKQQMVAGDLRLAVGGILIMREMERIADYAKLICLFSLKYNPEKIELDFISNLFDSVNNMLNIIAQLIDNYDVDQENKVISIEKKINQQFNEFNDLLIERILESKSKAEAEKIILVIRQLKNLERAGDHLINIEEILQFIRSGKFEEIKII